MRESVTPRRSATCRVVSDALIASFVTHAKPSRKSEDSALKAIQQLRECFAVRRMIKNTHSWHVFALRRAEDAETTNNIPLTIFYALAATDDDSMDT